MNYESLLNKKQIDAVPFYLSTPIYEVLAKNIVDKIYFRRATNLPGIISKIRKESKGRLVVGVIPFDINEGGVLYITD